MIVDLIFTILLLPFQLIAAPVDLLLSQFPGLESIPNTLSSVTGYLTHVPETLLYLTGISPVIWNALFLVTISYMTYVPAINAVKKIKMWVHR